MKKVKFNAELTAPNNALKFKLKRRSMSYPDIIGGDFYNELSRSMKSFRGKLANDLHGMQNNKKAIKAYKSS